MKRVIDVYDLLKKIESFRLYNKLQGFFVYEVYNDKRVKSDIIIS